MLKKATTTWHMMTDQFLIDCEICERKIARIARKHGFDEKEFSFYVVDCDDRASIIQPKFKNKGNAIKYCRRHNQELHPYYKKMTVGYP